jgi:hypothetical protein
VLEIAETCAQENPVQLITDYKVEANIKSDVEIIKDRLPAIQKNTGCKELYVDGGFYSDKVIEKSQENHVEIHFTNLSGKKPSKKMPITEFKIDENTNIIISCPKGITSNHTGITGGQTVAHFPLEACQNCEFKKTCYSKQQKKDCVVRLSLKAVQAAREREKLITCRKENTSMRAGIEGTNSA